MTSYNLLPIALTAALIVGATPILAQTGDKLTAQAAQDPTSAEGETLKERLSDKASDAQRVDNCKVPLDRRGTKYRPEGCKPDQARATPLKQP